MQRRTGPGVATECVGSRTSRLGDRRGETVLAPQADQQRDWRAVLAVPGPLVGRQRGIGGGLAARVEGAT